MKSEERHHLKENDLEKVLVQAQGFVEKNINLFIWGGVIIIGVIIAVFIIQRGPSEADQGAWSSLMQANSPEEFGKIANDATLEGKNVAFFAKLEEANFLYSRGVGLLFSDRKGALSDIEQAGENYAQLLEDTKEDFIVERALYGQACVQESTSGGDLTEAVATYEKLLTKYPSSVMVPIYKSRVERLKSGSAQALYKWMADNPAKPLDRTSPLDGQSTDPLQQFNIPLETKEENLEETIKKAIEESAEEKPVEETSETEEATTKEPAAEETTPEQDASATEKEAEPAESEQPAKPE